MAGGGAIAAHPLGAPAPGSAAADTARPPRPAGHRGAPDGDNPRTTHGTIADVLPPQPPARPPPFGMLLAGTGTFRPVSAVVFVVVAAGIAQCERLEAAVRSGPLARETRFPYHPHVTVAHDIPPDGLDRAYKGLAGFDARFPVPAFSVFAQETGGVWVPRKDFALGGS